MSNNTKNIFSGYEWQMEFWYDEETSTAHWNRRGNIPKGIRIFPFSMIVQTDEIVKINSGKNSKDSMKMDRETFDDLALLFEGLEECDSEFIRKKAIISNRHKQSEKIK